MGANLCDIVCWELIFAISDSSAGTLDSERENNIACQAVVTKLFNDFYNLLTDATKQNQIILKVLI